MRPKQDIVNDINQVQSLCGRLLMEIGLDYARNKGTTDGLIIAAINKKVDAYVKGEAIMRNLEEELAHTV